MTTLSTGSGTSGLPDAGVRSGAAESGSNPANAATGPLVNCSLKELADVHRRELRGAAVHEASHAALISKFGGYAVPEVWLNPSGLPEEKAWLGTCKMLAAPGKVKFHKGARKARGVVKNVPKRWRVYVGLAGFVGEQMAQGVTEAWEVAESFWSALDMDEISATDRDLIMSSGKMPTEHVFAKTISYLRSCWSEIEFEAEWLVTKMQADDPLLLETEVMGTLDFAHGFGELPGSDAL